jgi:nicotinate-nucleotide adenylyltransferase
MEKKNKKIGLFFGSFNPIHSGHLILAKYLLNQSDLSDIWFVVSPQNPLKDKKSLLGEMHRLQLVKIAIEDEPHFKAIDIEFKMPKPSYTIDTLIHLTEKYPKNKFVLIMGSDNINTINKWKNYEIILSDYEVYAYPRIVEKSNLPAIEHPNIKYISAPIIELSSTMIRAHIKEKKDVRYFLSEKVYDYVKEMHFYE